MSKNGTTVMSYSGSKFAQEKVQARYRWSRPMRFTSSGLTTWTCASASCSVAIPSAARAASIASTAARTAASLARAQGTFGTVLDAAVALIERDGVERATTRRIALAAGVSIGAVYEYFPNKESIVVHLGTNWLCRIREIIEALHPSRSAIPDLLSYVNRTLDDVARLYRDQPGLLAVLCLIVAIPELREAEQAHDAAVIASTTSALLHYVPEADPAEVQSTAN